MIYLKNGDNLETSKEHPLAILIKYADILTLKEQDEIYEKSNHFNNEIKEYVISENKYNISFTEKEMILNQINSDFSFTIKILKEPIKILFDTGNRIQNLYIKESLYYLQENLSEDYVLVQINKENNNNTYEIKLKKYVINEDLKNLYIKYDNKINFENYNTNKSFLINPRSLPPNFYSIFTKNIKEENFTIYFNLLDQMELENQ